MAEPRAQSSRDEERRLPLLPLPDLTQDGGGDTVALPALEPGTPDTPPTTGDLLPIPEAPAPADGEGGAIERLEAIESQLDRLNESVAMLPAMIAQALGVE